ncbi:hypothetical protein [Vibrio rumoiensis]|uniref:hypothetical protein n=1 Tax=Vibrio rumoiensis TaxID=76258 RepID=UPI000360343E|nr:hypothetical protein [Vibrio rumoiensis]
MTRLIAIAIFIVLAYLLIRYRANAKLQKWVAITLSSGFLLYIVYVVVSELIR